MDTGEQNAALVDALVAGGIERRAIATAQGRVGVSAGFDGNPAQPNAMLFAEEDGTIRLCLGGPHLPPGGAEFEFASTAVTGAVETLLMSYRQWLDTLAAAPGLRH